MKTIIFLTIFFISFPAHAQSANPDAAPRLEIDPNANVVNIIIEGNTVAQFTSSGLMVHGNVEYTGTLRDTGHLQVSRETESDEGSRNKSNAP